MRTSVRPARLLGLKVIAQETQLPLWIWKPSVGHGLDTEAARVKDLRGCVGVGERLAACACICVYALSGGRGARGLGSRCIKSRTHFQILPPPCSPEEKV